MKNKKRVPWNKGLKMPPMSAELREKHRQGSLGKGVGPRPTTWKWGSARDLRDKNRAFLVQRCQARYRNEKWQLTFHEFDKLWDDRSWARKGPKGWKLCMSRSNPKKGWSKSNVFLIKRTHNQLRLKQIERNLYKAKKKQNESVIFKGKRFENYHEMAGYYDVSYQTARNWRRFKNAI